MTYIERLPILPDLLRYETSAVADGGLSRLI